MLDAGCSEVYVHPLVQCQEAEDRKMGRGDHKLEGGTSTTANPLGEGTKHKCTHLCIDVYITLGCSRLLFVMEGSTEKTFSLLNKENMSFKEILKRVRDDA